MDYYVVQNVATGEIIDIDCQSSRLGYDVSVPELFTYSEALEYLSKSGFDNLEDWEIRHQSEIPQEGLRLEPKNYSHLARKKKTKVIQLFRTRAIKRSIL